MYPSSNSSSSSQPSRDHNTNAINNGTHGYHGGGGGGGGGIGLARYRSAPVSFLTTTVDSVVNGETGQQHTVGNHMVNGGTPTHFFSPPETTSSQPQTTSFRLNEFATAFNGLKDTNSPSPLFRHGSSPAGFLNTLVSSTPTDGRGSRLSSQISFAGTSSFSQMSHDQETNVTNPLVFNKRSKIDINGLNVMESEFNFGLSEGLETNTMMEQLPHDSVPCKIRAKRGCATHPRSIAERERRTRISGKLKKLQDLVPNMDKQTSYSDMLDLAVQHIKGLQTHVQNLKKELQNCSCGCKPN
ncbi:hypothetical protein L1987_09599 [Smallanthus sonchifolius]|uniref:Uncharacterized protein n=1 Tax=Smallanthus sonchifolius TaxID=185202 RepID=A0ACB9JPS1_9ASTR|nr:hypothetical protein L1987_09599 [Smallanthus sonchifolius]